jgi:hypothetical protein
VQYGHGDRGRDSLCLVERTAGENASDFDDPGKGTVDVCIE